MSHVSEFPWKWILRDQTKFKSRKRKSLWRVYVLNKTSHNCTELKWTTLCTYQWCLPRIRGWGKGNPRKFDFMKRTRVGFWHPQRRQGGKCDSAAILESGENLGMSDERRKISVGWVPDSLSCVPDFKAQSGDSTSKNSSTSKTFLDSGFLYTGQSFRLTHQWSIFEVL